MMEPTDEEIAEAEIKQLKTLKDITIKREELGRGYATVYDLRQEAIKWIDKIVADDFGRLQQLPKKWIGQKCLVIPISRYEATEIISSDKCIEIIKEVFR